MKKTNIVNFKKTLSKFVTGITIVCVKKDNKLYGKTVNSFNSLSLNPPLVLFSLGNYSSSLNIFTKSKYLSINILSNEQKNISNIFSKKKPDIDNLNFYEVDKKTYFIDKCIANLHCEVIQKIKKGDHIIFINKVLNIKYNDKLKPLSYFNSKYI